MSQQWYFTRDGKTYGPFPTAEIQRMTAQGLITSTDILWPEGSEPQVELVPLAELAAPAAPIIPLAVPVPAAASHRDPDWLGDVRRAEQAEQAERAKQAATEPQPPDKPAAPDWLDDLRSGERP